MDDDTRALLREIAGMRLVLVHVLARLPRGELQTISEDIDEELTSLDKVGMPIEAAFAPYRDSVDHIIADAAKRSGP